MGGGDGQASRGAGCAPEAACVLETARRRQSRRGAPVNREAYRLKPWNEVVSPHGDIVSGDLEMATYAADLGGVDRGDANVPKVYRDAREFFRTTYPPRNLRRLL